LLCILELAGLLKPFASKLKAYLIYALCVCVEIMSTFDFSMLKTDDYDSMKWTSIRSDLRGVTGKDMTCVTFANRVSYVIAGCNNVVPAEWDNSVRTPSEIMGLISKLIYDTYVADVSKHVSKIAALTSQMQNAINVEQRQSDSSSKSD